MLYFSSVTRKQSPNVYKSCPKNAFTRKIIDFDTFTKIAEDCERFGQIGCCQRLEKVAQSPINRQIWSHCTSGRFLVLLDCRAVNYDSRVFIRLATGEI